MKFPHDPQYNAAFDQIPNLSWYPYVGTNYSKSKKRLLVFAHNIPVKPEKYEAEVKRCSPKTHWTNAIEEFAYEQAKYTNAFRYFTKAAVGLDENYGYNSEKETKDQVDTFLQGIAYTNYIQSLVKSDSKSAVATHEQIEKSKSINKALLKILAPTHCICWGRHVFDYLRQTEGFKSEQPVSCKLRGFATTKLLTPEGKTIKLLKVFHPSMPGFDSKSPETRHIISSFLEG